MLQDWFLRWYGTYIWKLMEFFFFSNEKNMIIFSFLKENITIRFMLSQSSGVYWVVLNCKEFVCLLACLEKG